MVLTISSGYDPGYLTRAVATGRENYYLSAVAEHGEPPGIWTGLRCSELGLAVGSEVDNKVMERLYGAFIDPRDPEQAATLGRAPSRFAGNDDNVSALITELLAAEPDATPERRDELIMQAMKEHRAAEADERRFRGDRENRADSAATILRWLIGDDDHVPVRGENRGELVGGFGDVVRSLDQIAGVLALARDRRQRAAAPGRDLDAGPAGRRFAQQDIHYLDGVAATLAWVLGDRPEAPITYSSPCELTTRDLKVERLHAEDVIEQATMPWMADRVPPGPYGEGVKLTISWLLGDSILPPVGPVDRGATQSGKQLGW